MVVPISITRYTVAGRTFTARVSAGVSPRLSTKPSIASGTYVNWSSSNVIGDVHWRTGASSRVKVTVSLFVATLLSSVVVRLKPGFSTCRTTSTLLMFRPS